MQMSIKNKEACRKAIQDCQGVDNDLALMLSLRSVSTKARVISSNNGTVSGKNKVSRKVIKRS